MTAAICPTRWRSAPLTVIAVGFSQVIDDTAGRTIAAASSLDKDLRTNLKSGADKAAAVAVGKLVAERAKAAGVSTVVFDRGGYLFHGRVKALADAARDGGLQF